MSLMIHHLVLFIFMPEPVVPNLKIGLICFCVCIIVFASATILMLILLIIKQEKKLVSNLLLFLFAEKILMVILKVNMGFIASCEYRPLILTKEDILHLLVL